MRRRRSNDCSVMYYFTTLFSLGTAAAAGRHRLLVSVCATYVVYSMCVDVDVNGSPIEQVLWNRTEVGIPNHLDCHWQFVCNEGHLRVRRQQPASGERSPYGMGVPPGGRATGRLASVGG